MRTGFAASALAHAALIAFGLLSLGAAEPLTPEAIESISVDLVPISAFSNIRVGSLNSEIVETETPSAVLDETPPELAQVTGNTVEDQSKPTEADAPTPAPTLNTAPEPVAPEPEPVPVPEPKPEPQPEPEPVPPAPEPAPEPEPEPVAPAPPLAVAPAPEAPKEVVPAPVVRTAALEQKRAQFKKDQEEAKKKKAAEEAKKKEDEKKKREDAIEDILSDEADQVASIINNEDSRGATTGVGGEPTLGKPTGQSATLSQNEMDALVAAMRACFNPPPGAAEEGATARLLVSFNRDRSVAGQQVLAVTGTMGDVVARAAQRAVAICAQQQAYAMLTDDKYEQWRQVDVTFDPREF